MQRIIPKKFAYSHKSNDDFVFTSDKGRLVFNPDQQHICYYAGKQFIYYEAKEKEGMLELMVQYSTLEQGFEDVPQPFTLITLDGTPSSLNFSLI